MNVLVLNSGSSSLKFQIINTDLDKIASNSDTRLASGVIERIGHEAILTWSVEGGRQMKETAPIRDHQSAVDRVVKWIAGAGIQGVRSLTDIHVVGHRVVHGGETLTASTLIDDAVLKSIEDCIELAPLHNPANLKGVNAVRQILGTSMPQVAVFDTAFHHTLPDHVYLYAVPYQFYRRYKIRRYGFHGTSHRYIAYRYRTLMSMPKEKVNIITIHLGNGCSVCAIKSGVSVDTSMGLTPLEGLIMGTRSGDLDPAILHFLSLKEGFTLSELDTVLNKQSGLLGISGLTHDMRELVEEAREHDDRRAKLAIEMFSYRVRKYIGSYLATMNGADAIIFAGGIGENSSFIRDKICAGLEFLGISADPHKNQAITSGVEGPFHRENSKTSLWVIPTNEEMLIARDSVRCVTKANAS